ncbi:MAG: hypothetical protein KatS3mg076_1942 [Candidatus Binatia bacterium]|nr:MAG: hypothetical protein KatS3mg076_1942 [Candidatus Binatia bacterium]
MGVAAFLGGTRSVGSMFVRGTSVPPRTNSEGHALSWPCSCVTRPSAPETKSEGHALSWPRSQMAPAVIGDVRPSRPRPAPGRDGARPSVGVAAFVGGTRSVGSMFVRGTSVPPRTNSEGHALSRPWSCVTRPSASETKSEGHALSWPRSQMAPSVIGDVRPSRPRPTPGRDGARPSDRFGYGDRGIRQRKSCDRGMASSGSSRIR